MWVYIFFLSHLIIFLTQGVPLTQDQEDQLAAHRNSCPSCFGGETCTWYTESYHRFIQLNQQRQQSPPAKPQPPPIPQSQLPAVAKNVARFGLSGVNPMPAPAPISAPPQVFSAGTDGYQGVVASGHWKPIPRRTSSLEIRSDGPGGQNQNPRTGQLTIGTKRGHQMMMEPNNNQGVGQQTSNFESSSNQAEKQLDKKAKKSERNKQYYLKTKSDPEKFNELREKWKNRKRIYKQSGKIKSMNELTEAEQAVRREKNAQAKRKWKENQKNKQNNLH